MKTKIIIFLILNSSFLIPNLSKAQMFWNQAASFNGTSSSYIVVRNSSTINVTGSFTLEAWVNPNSSGVQMNVINKGLFNYYGLNIMNNGRVGVFTNGNIRLLSKTTTTIPTNQWTHIAATLHMFGTTNGYFSLFINGQPDTNSLVSSNINPTSNTDSLYIGSKAYPFSGMMDEVRIWNKDFLGTEIAENMRISLGTNGGKYSPLVLSMTFQSQVSSSFTTFDYSYSGNHGSNHGVTPVDLSNIPSRTILPNLSVRFGTDSYLAAPDYSSISPTTAVTLQAWISPYINVNSTIIHKGTQSGSVTDYSLNIINQKLAAKINNTVFDSQDTLPLDQWSHVSFSYFLNGINNVFGYRFCVNGKLVKSGNLTGINIANGTDSLYIGGSNTLPVFVGSIDEVRISNYAKSISDINDSLYMPMESVSYGTAAYNLDGNTWCNTGLYGPNLYFRGSASFTTTDGISPLNKGSNLGFQKGFYMKFSDHRIPESGYQGAMTDDTINVFLDEIISDINVFVSLDHDQTSDLKVDLIPPGGGRIYLTNLNSTIAPSNNITTIFNDQAATSLSNYTFTSFTSTVRSTANVMSWVNGTGTKGAWKLVIYDYNPSNAGRLYAWGIQFNNKTTLPKVLSSKSLIQGFYDPVSNLMTRDTMRCYLRSFPSPYPILDSAKAFLQSDGSASFTFTSLLVTNSNSYYFQFKHRNAIETWTKSLLTFPSLQSQLTLDITTDSAKAFGSNLVRVDNSPLKYAIYNCDVNQDDIVDAGDLINVYNSVTSVSAGYISTDVTGDNFADASDLILTYNNANANVQAVLP